MQVKLIFRFQEGPDEDLDVAEAFSKNPDAVRDVLGEAICQVELPASEFELLRIVRAFQSALQAPWSGYRPLGPILEACRQENYGHNTERIFHQHAQEEGVVALGLVAKYQNQLINAIDALPEARSIRLARLVKSIPKKQSVLDFIETNPRRTGMLLLPLQFFC
jgi:hypothetical protein